MEILINDQVRTEEVQQVFSTMFPFLKIEVYNRAGSFVSAEKNTKQHDRSLGECRTVHAVGKILLSPQMTSKELEELFKTEYGLRVKIFRKSGKLWLETTLTGDWTLGHQNKEGEALSNGGPPKS